MSFKEASGVVGFYWTPRRLSLTLVSFFCNLFPLIVSCLHQALISRFHWQYPRKDGFTSHRLPPRLTSLSLESRQDSGSSIRSHKLMGSVLLDSAWQSVVIAFPSFSVIISLLSFLELIKSSPFFPPARFQHLFWHPHEDVPGVLVKPTGWISLLWRVLPGSGHPPNPDWLIPWVCHSDVLWDFSCKGHCFQDSVLLLEVHPQL